MKNVTVKEIVKACNGILLCGKDTMPILHVSYDSREKKEKMLFVPLLGERADGHSYISSAFENGAVATFTCKHKLEDIPNEQRKYAWILVEDTKMALQRVAAWYRRQLAMPILGVTGSVGKTTTRAMIAEALSGSFSVYQTKGNLNSQVGVPVMLLETGEEEIAVLEMGISEFGEMDRLTQMVAPEIAVITCIGVAHIEQLKTREHICMEKMAITHGMKQDGILLLNGDDKMLAQKKNSVPQKVYYYGTGKECEFRAEHIHMEGGNTEFLFVCQEDKIPVSIPTLGRHNVLNALAALAVCKLSGASVEDGAKKLSKFQGIAMRQQIYQMDSYTIIDDSYNANPDSMKAGLQVLMEYPAQGRKVAVLGDMLELGEQEIEFHREIGKFAAEIGVDNLCTFGILSFYMEEAAKQANKQIQTKHFENREELAVFLKRLLKPEDVVLLKGSRGMKLNLVADTLKEQ